ncbi:MAG: M20/M25/M40 family metallo-hydrolase [Nannocystaceae bacterium]|nr:M20/M25/M40 family metallo-hydrolase [Nannocystaceae bacterium]
MTDSMGNAGQGDALRQHVSEVFETTQVPFFRDLVEAPSHTKAKDDVEAAARIFDAAMDEMGFVRTLVADDSGTYADHRIHESPGVGAAPCLALVGHIDTVFPRSMGFLHYERDGDIVRGPGVLDMKSGLSCMVLALSALRSVDRSAFDRLAVRLVCNADEEVGSPTSDGIFADLAPRTSAALVFEGGRDGDKIITRRKGGGMFTFDVEGRAAHAGVDHAAGVNAIAALSHLVPRIEALTAYDRGVTANVGLIEGGTAKNTVPEHARCVIDTRFETVADAQAVRAALQAIADAPWDDTVPQRLHAATVQLGGAVTRPPMEATDDSQALRGRYEVHAAAAGLAIGEAPRQGGGSDANLLAAHGVPTIDGLGPFGKFFHEPQEWSSLASLLMRTQALACFLAEQASQ